MTGPPEDSWLLGLRPQPRRVTAEEYQELPEEISRAVEIVSPGSETQDTTDKLGEYARAEIPYYWIVRLDATGVSTVERYQLDPSARLYKHLGTFMKDAEGGDPPTVANPIPVTLDWAELEY